MQKDIVTYCHKHGITFEAYSPLQKGEVLDVPEVKEVAMVHNVTAAQVMTFF